MAPETFDFGGGSLRLQPFAFTATHSSKKHDLPIGPKLRHFLNDPLGGAAFDLTLPFSNAHVALSDHSAIIRGGTTESVWHTAVDLDMNGDTTRGFDVVATADGVVEGTSATSTSLVIRHVASNRQNFLTIYQHLVPASKAALSTVIEAARSCSGSTRQRRSGTVLRRSWPARTRLKSSSALKAPGSA